MLALTRIKLEKENHKIHTKYCVVIRHLHQSTPVDCIKGELNSIGFRTRNITNVIYKKTKTPLPLFFVDIEPISNNRDIFKIDNLYYIKI